MANICDYGCNQEGKFQLKNGKWSCSQRIWDCHGLRKKLKHSSSKSACTKSGWKQPTKECSICGKNVSAGNHAKHEKACRGDGKKQTRKCKVCSRKFLSYYAQVTCSMECRDVWLSIQTKEQYRNGRKPCGYRKNTFVYESVNQGTLKVMSSYEFAACQIFDQWLDKGKIKSWEYTTDSFSYTDENGDDRTYFPDFKIFPYDEQPYYVETKGFETIRDQFKWAAVQESGFELQVWFEDDISEHTDDKD